MRSKKLLCVSLFFWNWNWIGLSIYFFNYKIQDWMGILLLVTINFYLLLCLADITKIPITNSWLYVICAMCFVYSALLSWMFFVRVMPPTVRMSHVQIPVLWLPLSATVILIIFMIAAGLVDKYESNKVK